MKQITVCLVLTLTLAAYAEKQPFERYQSIIDRQMFGPLPKDFDPTKMPSEVSRSGSAAAEKELTQEQAKLQSAIHFSVINVDHSGKTVVGFTDNSDPKAPVHYYLRVGESQNGWTVREADPEQATMTIAKDEIEVSLKLGDNSGKGGGKTAAAAPAAGGGGRRGVLGGPGGSLRARRAARRQAAEEAAQKSAAEAAEKEAQRKAQADQERAEREAEKEQQRQQLMAIQEELRKAREQRQAEKKENADDNAE